MTSGNVDPNQFIITRKRKRYKFAKFYNSPLCYEKDEWQRLAEKPPVAVVELGAGTALFLVEMAARRPEVQFAAVDVKGDRLQTGAYEAMARGLTNIVFIRARADQLHELFTAGSLQQLWLTFADPFPKRRSAGRRMTHPHFLRQYAALLAETGDGLLIKHDNLPFFAWSLEQLVAEKWRLQELSFDLHDSKLPDEYKILTTYEQRWLHEGLHTKFVRALPPQEI